MDVDYEISIWFISNECNKTMSVRDKDVIEESINFHADTIVMLGGGKNAGSQANISR